MTRYLTVTCTRQRCQEDGRVEIRGLTARQLPAGWLAVLHGYDADPMEFCSLACLGKWCEDMQKAHQRQRAWQERKAS